MENTHLFSPLTIRSLVLKNRIALSPMQQYSAVDGIPNQWHMVHLGSRAVGGAGLIITECTAVRREGLNTLSDTGLWNDTQVDAWKPIVKFVQEQGAKIAVQLWHAGGKGSHKHPNEGMKPLLPAEGGWATKSSSAVVIDGILAEELTIPEIKKIQAYFVAAAKRAIAAGFDSIELHAGHGYLFHQFYSAVINKRADEYGGSFENRIRFLVETVREIRKVLPTEMPLLARISAVDYLDVDDAWTIEDSMKLAQILKDAGVDLITASGGGFANYSLIKVFPSYQLPFATALKDNTNVLTGTVGAITEAEQANKIIAEGKADLVVIAKELLRNPYFPLNAAIALGLKNDVPIQYKRAY